MVDVGADHPTRLGAGCLKPIKVLMVEGTLMKPSRSCLMFKRVGYFQMNTG